MPCGKKKVAKKKQAKKQVVHKKKKLRIDKEVAGFWFSNPKEE